MKKTTSNYSSKSLLGTLRRYHLTLFIVVVVGGLIAAILILNGVLNQSASSGNLGDDAGTMSFDQATIDRLDNLGSDSNDQKTPSGRTNPFTE